jgi:hypothetical protein
MPQDNLPSAAHPAALTDALRSAGVLPDGHVADVHIESDQPTILSRILRLRLSYDQPAPNAPATLFLKTGLPGKNNDVWNSGRQEVAFYTTIAPALPADSVPRCFSARHDHATGDWHLLLQDLTDTHVRVSEWPLPPTQSQCQTILAARARLHAAWWDHPDLGITAGTWPDETAVEQWRQRMATQYAMFADRLGDTLPPDRRALFEQFLDAVPRLRARLQTRRNVTIVQGDSHVWNCFLPRDGNTGVRFFDWDAWRPHVPTVDLAYMMALHWYPDHRRHVEQPLLDLYHQSLQANGVTGYDRSALNADYRWAVLMQLATPVSQAAFNLPAVIWWNHLQRIMMAVDDLGCRELLK